MTIEEIKKIAELSMLEYSDEELMAFKEDFSAMDEKIARLNGLELGGVTYKIPVKEYEELREDEVKPSSDRADTLKNAPRKDSISFILPKVVE